MPSLLLTPVRRIGERCGPEGAGGGFGWFDLLRYATLESARLIHGPSMGHLRRPTPGEIVEGGRLGRPCRPGAYSRAFQKSGCGFAAILR